MNISSTKPPNPVNGQMYYDIGNFTNHVYFDGDWHNISNTNTINAKYVWIPDTKLPYAKIYDRFWFMDNYDNIIKWLHDNDAGTYSPILASIVFNSKELATFFELKFS